MKKKNGFTLIELLAVIIILGVLMIIAVPAVTKYINDSRKESYVSIAKNIAGGARNLVNSGAYEMYDKDITYYVDGNCIKTENGFKSPYGDFTKAYIAITVSDEENEYYWTSVDETGTGVKNLIKVNDLDVNNIENGISSGDITTTIGIDGRNKIVVIGGEQCTKSDPIEASKILNIQTGKLQNACPAVTETIYWAVSNNKLTISNGEVSGTNSGSFSSDAIFTGPGDVPWISSSMDLTEIEVLGEVVPKSTDNWFSHAGSNSTSFSVNLENLEVCHTTRMKEMFAYAGQNATTWVVNGISSWNTSNVSNMSEMFYYAGQKAQSFDLNLSNWDTSNLENIYHMFYNAGSNATIFNINLSNWDTSKISQLNAIFYNAGSNATTFNVNVSNWNTSHVTEMYSTFSSAGKYSNSWSITGLNTWNTENVEMMEEMFYYTGYNAQTFNIDISNWNMSKVSDMSRMFYSAGELAQNFSIIIPKTNSNGLNNTSSLLYGSDSTCSVAPPTGRSFTVAD